MLRGRLLLVLRLTKSSCVPSQGTRSDSSEDALLPADLLLQSQTASRDNAGTEICVNVSFLLLP